MKNERLHVIPWPKSFAYMQLSAIIIAVDTIRIVHSTNVYEARIAFGSAVIASVVMAVSFWKFRKEVSAQNSRRKEN